MDKLLPVIQLVTLGVVGAAAVATIALALAVVALARLGRLRRKLNADLRALSSESSGSSGSGSPSLPPTATRSRPPGGPPDEVTFDPRAIRDVAIVRYDALQEMGGQLSFSLALLNAVGDGVIVTSINGRTETRTYAKIIRGGEPTHPLSPEEERAIREARRGSASVNGSVAGSGGSGPSGRARQPDVPAYSRTES